jgi:hypothetical protein
MLPYSYLSVKRKAAVAVLEAVHRCHVLTTKAYMLVPKVECRVQCNYVLDTTSPQFFMGLGQIKRLELGMLPVRTEL